MEIRYIPINMRNPIATKPLSKAGQVPAEPLVCKKSEVRCFTPVYFHSALSFKGSHVQEFSDLMDFVKANPKKVTSELLSKMEGLFEKVICSNYNEEHFINKGSLGEVYRINEKYVFKIERNQEIDTKCFKLVNEEVGNDLDLWYGGIKAKTGNVSIMSNADPAGNAVIVGVPLSVTKAEQIEKHYIENYLPRAVSMPQSAFDKLAGNFKKLNAKTCKGKFYSFDFNNLNNFLLLDIDEIRVVDELREVNSENSNNLASMLRVFLVKYRNILDANFYENLVPQRKNILTKCILANEKAELPMEFSRAEQWFIDSALKLAGSKVKGEDFIDTLEQMRTINPDIECRLKAVKEYLDKI